MISADNKPLNDRSCDSDFTESHYRELCQLAVKHYPIADYRHIPWGKRFVLWRHDMDYSLNRGLALAKAEHDLGLKATYFLNPHSEFYNLAETSQHAIIKKFLALGHDIGLHFDSGFFGEITEAELNDLVAHEAAYMEWLFKIKPVAFSFHNPVTSTLLFEADDYGGLLNCYSKRFKTEVGYCSDSNGYWRFRRLYDVLSEAKEPCLQVLTHPGWWQDKPMPPRQRIFRCAYGRAAATLRTYDTALEQYGRLNHAGAAGALSVLKASQPQRFELCDYLWNQGEFQTLFLELWCLHEEQINRLCKARFRKEWDVPVREVNTFFSSDGLMVDGWKLFKAVFEIPWSTATAIGKADHQNLQRIHNQIVRGRLSVSATELEQGCILLCGMIHGLAEWGRAQSISYDGLMHLDSIGLPTVKTSDRHLSDILDDVNDGIQALTTKHWEVLKKKLAESSNSIKDSPTL